MTYYVYINNVLVHDTKSEDDKMHLINPVIRESVNKAGSFSFSMRSDTGFDVSLGSIVLVQMKTKYTNAPKEVFYGKITSSIETDRIIQCSADGIMAYYDGAFEYVNKFNGTINSAIYNLGNVNYPSNGDLINIKGTGNSWGNAELEIYVPVSETTVKQLVFGGSSTGWNDKRFDHNTTITLGPSRHYVKTFKTVPYMMNNGLIYRQFFIRMIDPNNKSHEVTFAPYKITTTVDTLIADAYLRANGATTSQEIEVDTCEAEGNMINSSLTKSAFANAEYKRIFPTVPTTITVEPNKFYRIDLMSADRFTVYTTAEYGSTRYDFQFSRDSVLQNIKDITINRFGGLLRFYSPSSVDGEADIRYWDDKNIPSVTQTVEYGKNLIADSLKIERNSGLYSGIVPIVGTDNQDIGIPTYKDLAYITSPVLSKYGDKKKTVRIDIKDKEIREIETEIRTYIEDLLNEAEIITFDAVDLSYTGEREWYAGFELGYKTTATLKDGRQKTVYCVGSTRYLNAPENDRYNFSTVLDANRKISNMRYGNKKTLMEKQTEAAENKWYELRIVSTALTTPTLDPLKIKKNGDTISLKGTVTTKSSYDGDTTKTIANIPAGYKPKNDTTVIVSGDNEVTGRITVTHDGLLQLTSIRSASGEKLGGGENIHCTFTYTIS